MGGTSSIRIRLQRFGRPHRPFYRIVACKRKAPRDGKFLEILGTYDPIPDTNGNKQVSLKVDSVKKWMVRGAEPSDRVAKLLAIGELLPPVPRRALLRDHSLLEEPPQEEEEEEDGEDAEASSSEEADDTAADDGASAPAASDAAGESAEGAGEGGPRT